MKTYLEKQSRTSGTKPGEQMTEYTREPLKRPSPLLAAPMFGFVHRERGGRDGCR